jgi:shikimate dehydrogenase
MGQTMFETYSGATKIIPLLGHPIAQTKSPYGMTRGFAARGVDAIVVPVHVLPEHVAGYLDALDHVENLGGVMATVPHKFALCAHADTVTDRAAFFGSANVMRRDAAGRWRADMLDGLGLVRAFARAGGSVAGARALLVGAGGAGSSIALEILNAGAASIAVHDTETSRRDLLIAKLNDRHPGKASAGTASPEGFGVVVNGTPLGMRAGDAAPIDLDRIDPAMLVGDVVTAKDDTQLVRAAKAAGCICCSGHDMFEASLDLMLDFFIEAAAPDRADAAVRRG